MTIPLDERDATPPARERVEAVAAFLREDPARILAMAATLRGSGRPVESTVRGPSMTPALPAGCRIRIELTTRERATAGDVAAFVAAGQVVVHRIVHRGRHGPGRGWLLTRGDASWVPDPPVAEPEILGRVTTLDAGQGWRAVPPAARRPVPAAMLRALLLAGTAGALVMGPGPAAWLVAGLRRAELAWRRTRRRMGLAPGSPTTTSRAA